MNNPSGCRSKFSLLPQQVRWHAYGLLLDGATLKSLQADPVVSEALERSGFTLNSANLNRIRQSCEYAEFARMRQKFLETKYSDMMLSAIAKNTGALESMTDQARCKLLEALSGLTDLSDLPDDERIKALRSLSQSLAALSNPARDGRIAELRRKLRENENVRQAAESGWKARETELLNRIAELESPGKAASGMSPETLAAVEKKIKLL